MNRTGVLPLGSFGSLLPGLPVCSGPVLDFFVCKLNFLCVPVAKCRPPAIPEWQSAEAVRFPLYSTVDLYCACPRYQVVWYRYTTSVRPVLLLVAFIDPVLVQ